MMKENSYQIFDDRIDFQFYNLYFSSLHCYKSITLDRINAIDLKTSPHSLIIDSREVVFLNHSDSHSLPAFAEKHQLPYSSHIDTWAILTRDYLDTYTEAQIQEAENEKLQALGIGQEEYKKISKSLCWTLFGTLEWQYLGLWDVLAMKQHRNPLYRFYGKSYYWQLMAIALRGSPYITAYRASDQNPPSHFTSIGPR